MRAALVETWPDLSFAYGLRPWHTGLLTPGELAAYIERLPSLLQLLARR